MNNYTFAQINNLASGDVLIGPKSQFEIVDHYSIYHGKDYFGRDLYMDNNVSEGVRYMYEEQFLQNNPSATLKIRRLEGNNGQRQQAMQRAESLHGKSYHLTQFNCEHFANYVQYNTAFSTQVSKSGNGVLVAASLFGLLFVLGNLFGE